MNDTARQVETFEEYTLYSLERSEDGLRELIKRSRALGAQWSTAGAPATLVPQLKSFCNDISAFDVFQTSVNGMFMLHSMPAPNAGKWKTAVESLQDALNQLLESLEQNRTVDVYNLLDSGIPASIEHFIQILPNVRQYIAQNFKHEPAETTAEQFSK